MLPPFAATHQGTLKFLLQSGASVAKQQLLTAQPLQVNTVPQAQSLHCRVKEGLQALSVKAVDAQPWARFAPPPT